MTDRLKVNEIFLSVQGESTRAGLPCVFVRLAGCNLRCLWCDTQEAWYAGREVSLRDIMLRVGRFGCPRVEVTGGEPLIQPGALELLRRLAQAGYETLLETNGSQDISRVDARASKILDIKCPSSGEAESMRWENIECLTGDDEVKFVIADRRDYDYAREITERHGLNVRCPVTFSPVAGELDPADLAAWMLDDRIDVRLGVQLHRLIWPERARGV